MDLKQKIGIKNYNEIVVSEKDTAAKHGSGSIEVFATPAMISLMENTALNLVQEFLPDNFSTVGTEISVKHLKATAIGQKVSCKSELVDVDGNRLNFKVEASDETGIIGKGKHTRFIVDIEKFMNKLSK